jgi:hypothetical protein
MRLVQSSRNGRARCRIAAHHCVAIAGASAQRTLSGAHKGNGKPAALTPGHGTDPQSGKPVTVLVFADNDDSPTS